MVIIPFYDLAAENQRFRPELDEAYRRVMEGGNFILGSEVDRFESEFARFCGADEAVGVGSGLDALKLSLRALNIGPGDEVIVAAHTFVATWMAIVDVGATPVPCEPDPGSFLISDMGVAPLITTRTRAVIPVHLYGFAAQIGGLARLCATHGLHLVEDAAQAHGARHGGRACGSAGSAGCFSFYPSKNLGALGDGGAVVSSDPDLVKRLRSLRNYGSGSKRFAEETGWNSRLDELQAAFLRVKLARLKETNALRVRAAHAYEEQLRGVAGITLPRSGPEDEPVWHLYPIQVQQRDALRAWLLEAGIQTGIHYEKPVYRMERFRAFGPNKATPSDRLSAELLSLPFWPTITMGIIERVCGEIRGSMSRHGR